MISSDEDTVYIGDKASITSPGHRFYKGDIVSMSISNAPTIGSTIGSLKKATAYPAISNTLY